MSKQNSNGGARVRAIHLQVTWAEKKNRVVEKGRTFEKRTN